jgi:hypothetical protein
MRQVRMRKPVRSVLVIAVSTAAVMVSTAPVMASTAPVKASTAPVMVGPASAGSVSPNAAYALLYDYEFAGTTGTVANSAPYGPVAPLTLEGASAVTPPGSRRWPTAIRPVDTP